ncbi:MAG: DUF4129 domain-containing protein [Planctomycetota bacterium]|jgi:hypothetical protein
MEVVLCLLLLVAPTPAEVDQAARRVLSDAAYQTELPEGAAHPGTGTPSGTFSGGEAADRDFEARGAFSMIARLVWWILIGVAVAIGIAWLARELGARYDKAPRPAAAPGAAPRAAPPSHVDAEGLAGAGRYGEAIHALLLRVLSELRKRANVQPAWTSREVVTHVPLADAAREGLRTLVHAVERTHFGGVPADAAEYRRRAEDAAALLSQLPKGSRG